MAFPPPLPHMWHIMNYAMIFLSSSCVTCSDIFNADEIREDIEDAVSRMKPWGNTEGATEFSGWARMALPIATFSVVEVGAPHVGEDHPSRVRADVTVELTMAETVKREWEGVCVCVRACLRVCIHSSTQL